MNVDSLEALARALYEALDAAIPANLNVEGEITLDSDVDLAGIELDAGFNHIDAVLDALKAYARKEEAS